jgi:hypothetical protein
VREVAPDRLIRETENVDTIRVLLAPLFKPGEFRALSSSSGTQETFGVSTA